MAQQTYENKSTNTIYTNPQIHLFGNQKKVKQLENQYFLAATASKTRTKIGPCIDGLFL